MNFDPGCGNIFEQGSTTALWFRSTRIQAASIELLAYPFVLSLILLIHLLALNCLRSAALIHSQACWKLGILMSQNQAVLNHSAP